MGIDYRHGRSGHSDARLQANLNYKFGMPLSAQLSPDSVASMRTLAGSRYDLVERNNNIVLDHKENPRLDISLPKALDGYSANEIQAIAAVVSNKPTKPVTWRAEETFSKNGGVLPVSGNPITMTLPKYNPNGDNSYPIYATVELEDGKLSRTAEMTVTVSSFTPEVEPFKGDMEVSPKEGRFGNGTEEYTYRVLIVDPKNGKPLRNYKPASVEWGILDNKLPNNVKFKEKKTTTNNDGYLTASLVSNVGVDGVKIKVDITADDGNKYSSNSDKIPVDFKPVIQEAGLLIFSRHEYTRTQEKNKPYNVHEGLTITLTKKIPGNHAIAQFQDHIEYKQSSDLVKIVNRQITFPSETFTSSKSATVIATVTEAKTGAKYAYTYTFNPKRYVFSPDVGEVKLKDNGSNKTCEKLDRQYSLGRGAESMTEDNVRENSSDPNSLGNEYRYSVNDGSTGFSGFGFLPYRNPKDMKVKIKSTNKESNFILYHYYEMGGLIGIDPEDSGLLLCQIKE
ncbi:hypothetical protein XIS1_240001 [Xenorhabdus innexi]|nr:hypothetical protein XIS1_240001 [Xenorhabdus innexi]